MLWAVMLVVDAAYIAEMLYGIGRSASPCFRRVAGPAALAGNEDGPAWAEIRPAVAAPNLDLEPGCRQQGGDRRRREQTQAMHFVSAAIECPHHAEACDAASEKASVLLGIDNDGPVVFDAAVVLPAAGDTARADHVENKNTSRRQRALDALEQLSQRLGRVVLIE